jgi:amidase
MSFSWNSPVTEIIDLSALDLSAAIHARQISCREVMTAYLDRIDAVNPLLNAIVGRRDRDELLAEAATRDDELAAGRSRGWLHGLPIAIKDLSPAKGLRFTSGSLLFADLIAAEDDIHVARIRAAGAVVIGKTNTPEMGLGSHTYNDVFGATRNPHDPTRSAGGSSGGAAAALAARMLPIADGSDMMGSLRNPAAFNNVVGFRPTPGRVPQPRPLDLFMVRLGVVGSMGRTVRDAAALFATQAGYDRRDPLSLPNEDFHSSITPDVSGARIAWFGDMGGRLACEPGVLDVDRQALAVLAALGCRIEEVVPAFDLDRLWDAWNHLRSWHFAGSMRTHYENADKRTLIKPELIWEIEQGRSLAASDLCAAAAVRSEWYRFICGLFERYDFLALPSAQVFPFAVDKRWPDDIDGKRMDTYHRWMEVVIGPSLAGLPTVAVPAGFGANGLPTGIQIAGPPRADRRVLELTAAYEDGAAALRTPV